MKVFKYTLVALFASLMMFSCTDDGDDTPAPSIPTTPTDIGNGTLEFIGETIWRADAFTATYRNGKIEITAGRKSEYFKLNMLATSTGTYTISGSDDEVSARFFNGISPEYSTTIGGVGTVVINDFRDDTIRGDFIVQDMANISGDLVSFTDGKFVMRVPGEYEIFFDEYISADVGANYDLQINVGKIQGADEALELKIDFGTSGITGTFTPSEGNGAFTSSLFLDFKNASKGNFVLPITLHMNGVQVYQKNLNVTLIQHEAFFLEGDYVVTEKTFFSQFRDQWEGKIELDQNDLEGIRFTNFLGWRLPIEARFSSGQLSVPNVNQEILEDKYYFEKMTRATITGSGEKGTKIVMDFDVYDSQAPAIYRLRYEWVKQ